MPKKTVSLLVSILAACGPATRATGPDPATTTAPQTSARPSAPEASNAILPAASIEPSRAPRTDIPTGTIAFEDLDTALAPEASYHLGDHLEMGGGVGLVDLDGDGNLDLLLTSERGTLHTYRNDGHLGFAPLAPPQGLPALTATTAAALGDCDGDGSLEIFLSRLQVPALYRKAGSGWAEVKDAGFDAEPVVMGLGSTFLDADGDGDLDILQTVYRNPVGSVIEPPRLWINDGACHFHRLTDPGLQKGMGVDVGVLDYDRDGAPDMLVATDFGMLRGPTRLYRNLGGSFIAVEAGIDGELYGMGVGIGDLDNDGLIDAYVAQIGRNPFLHNLGNGSFRDDSSTQGIGNAWYLDPDQAPLPLPYYDPDSPNPDAQAQARYLLAYATQRPADPHSFLTTSWAAVVADLDADGFNDLLVTNGVVGVGFLPEGSRQRTVLYQGSSIGFSDVSSGAGLDLPGTHKGAALGDLDGDGLQDLVLYDDGMGNPRPRHKVLRNVATAGHFLRVQLKGKAPNTWAIGARVEVSSGGKLAVAERTLHSGIYSASADAMFFGLGASEVADTVTVHWPWNAGVTTLSQIPVGDVTVTQP